MIIILSCDGVYFLVSVALFSLSQKNEGTALYLPLCAVAAFWIVWRKIAMRTMTLAQALRLAAPGIVLFSASVRRGFCTKCSITCRLVTASICRICH